MNFRCLKCAVGSYSLTDGMSTFSCLTCPQGVICLGGTLLKIPSGNKKRIF